MPEPTPVLRRYTSLPALLHLLRKRALTLVSPSQWEDRNDSRYIELYREKRGLGAIRALCFTEASETFHHWRVFTEPVSGVCIHFRRGELLRVAGRDRGTTHGPVRYRRLSDARSGPPTLAALPFVKRWAFRDEREYRILWETPDTIAGAHTIAVPLGVIERVTLAPGMHRSLAEEVKAALREIPGCARLPVVHSQLLQNDEWVRLGQGARTR